MNYKKMSRRDFFKIGGVGAAGLFLASKGLSARAQNDTHPP